MTGSSSLHGRRVLVVEDDYFITDDMVRLLQDNGAEVIGPAGDIDGALDLIEGADHLDGALLDINLRGEMAYPVADLLLERGVPFVFTTGYDAGAIPARYSRVKRCDKPVTAEAVLRVLSA